MKNVSILLFLHCIFQAAGQNDSLLSDNIPIGKVTYLHIEHGAVQKYKNGRATLLFNPVKSVYTLDEAPKKDITLNVNDVQQYISGDPEGLPVYKLHAEKRILFKTTSPLARGFCVVEDTLGAIQWMIHEDKKQFGLLVCQKATGIFRGREYEAWFAMDIPISSGPFKLGGLPGLILEARSMDGEVEFLFQGLEMSPNIPGVIKPPSGKRLNMDYATFKKAEAELNSKKEKEYQAQGIIITFTPSGDQIELDQK